MQSCDCATNQVGSHVIDTFREKEEVVVVFPGE